MVTTKFDRYFNQTYLIPQAEKTQKGEVKIVFFLKIIRRMYARNLRNGQRISPGNNHSVGFPPSGWI